jgi:hypothetical protein
MLCNTLPGGNGRSIVVYGAPYSIVLHVYKNVLYVYIILYQLLIQYRHIWLRCETVHACKDTTVSHMTVLKLQPDWHMQIPPQIINVTKVLAKVTKTLSLPRGWGMRMRLSFCDLGHLGSLRCIYRWAISSLSYHSWSLKNIPVSSRTISHSQIRSHGNTVQACKRLIAIL